MCIVSEISITPEVRGDNPVAVIQTVRATFQINNAKLYVPVVTFSINNNIKCLENIKQGFKRAITFRNINRLFVLLFKNGNNDPMRFF